MPPPDTAPAGAGHVIKVAQLAVIIADSFVYHIPRSNLALIMSRIAFNMIFKQAFPGQRVTLEAKHPTGQRLVPDEVMSVHAHMALRGKVDNVVARRVVK